MTAIRWIWPVLRTENLRSSHYQKNENKSQKVCRTFSFKNYVQIESFAVLRKRECTVWSKTTSFSFPFNDLSEESENE